MTFDVTVCVLVYRSPAWLEQVLRGLREAYNANQFGRVLVVANDAEPPIRNHPRVDLFHTNPPGMDVIPRIYRAWNAAIAAAQTQWVVPVNSDMVVSDGWLDALIVAQREDPGCIPTSLLVESGTCPPSAFPEYVRDFGRTPETFDWVGWRQHANEISLREGAKISPGRLFMPALLNREEVLSVGGYPAGNIGRHSGDAVLFQRLRRRHVTVHGSVVYHCAAGERGRPY